MPLTPDEALQNYMNANRDKIERYQQLLDNWLNKNPSGGIFDTNVTDYDQRVWVEILKPYKGWSFTAKTHYVDGDYREPSYTQLTLAVSLK